MKLDNNKYELKSYIINRTNEYAILLANAETQEDIVTYSSILKVLNDIQKICDKRNRY